MDNANENNVESSFDGRIENREYPKDDVTERHIGSLTSKFPNLSGDRNGRKKSCQPLSPIHLLFVHYFNQSSIKQFVNGSKYALFMRYLGTPGHIYRSISSLWYLFWTLKFVFAIMSDMVPFMGYRRKSYMAFGWLIALLAFLGVSLLPYPEPYYKVEFSNGTCNPTREVVNENSLDLIFSFALLLGIAKFAVAIMDCTADGKLIEFSRQEDDANKGNVVSFGHLIQKIGSVFVSVILMFSLNGAEYGGEFCFGIPFNFLSGGFCIFSLLGMIVVLSTAEHEVDRKSYVLKKSLGELFDKLKELAVLRVGAYVFVYMFMYNTMSTAHPKIKSYWANVTPFTSIVGGLLSVLLHSVGILIYKTYFSKTSWRKLVFVSFLFVLVPNFIVESVTVFDVVRNQYFYFSDDFIEAIPEGINYVIVMQIAAEVCGDKLEGSVFAVLMSIYILALPVSNTLSNALSSLFDVSHSDRYINDSYEDRLMVFFSLCAAYLVKFALFPLVILLLPDQRDHLSKIAKSPNSKSTRNAVIFIVFFLSALSFSILGIFLSLNEKTSCLMIAGGRGCD